VVDIAVAAVAAVAAAIHMVLVVHRPLYTPSNLATFLTFTAEEFWLFGNECQYDVNVFESGRNMKFTFNCSSRA